MEFFYFLVAHFAISYVGPLLVILVSYVLVFHRIWRRQIPSVSPPIETSSHSAKQSLYTSKMQALRMLAAVVVFFILSFLPLYAIFMHYKLMRFQGQKFTKRTQDFWMWGIPIAQWMSSANSCFNPIFYNFLDPKFRSRFRQMLQFLFPISAQLELIVEAFRRQKRSFHSTISTAV